MKKYNPKETITSLSNGLKTYLTDVSTKRASFLLQQGDSGGKGCSERPQVGMFLNRQNVLKWIR